MSSFIGLPAILSTVKSRVDRSWSLTFETREMAEEVPQLMALLQTEGHLIFAPNKDIADSANIPEVNADSGLAGKSPSQRLRSVLYVFWEQRGKKGSFDGFYLTQMEKLIDTVKAQLEPADESSELEENK